MVRAVRAVDPSNRDHDERAVQIRAVHFSRSLYGLSVKALRMAALFCLKQFLSELSDGGQPSKNYCKYGNVAFDCAGHYQQN